MWRLQLKAGALQLTVYIMIVIALLLSGFILLVHTHKQFGLQSQLTIETVQNTHRALQYVIEQETKLKDTITINLNDQDYKSLKVYRDYWGVFEKVTSVSQIKSQTFKKAALLGGTQDQTNRTALYVADNNKPLVLVGSSKIEGQSFLPKQGVKRGTIAGQFYSGTQLIYGQQRLSSNLPDLQEELKTQLKSIQTLNEQEAQVEFINLEAGQSYSNSFLNPKQIAYSNQTIELVGMTLTGHLVIQSPTKIIVDPSSKLTDVLLIAPEIEIRANTVGKFQALAEKQISVAENVTLNYPSALVIQTKDYQQEISNSSNLTDSNQNSSIQIADDAYIAGLVLFRGEDSQANNFEVQVKLNENATILGELYCNQNTELLGTVYGSVFTNNFIAKQSGSVYQNHIYNGRIAVEELPSEYIGLVFKKSNKNVLKWLY